MMLFKNKSEDYGKYETWNKLSFNEFDKYLNSELNSDAFYKTIYPKIKKLVRDTFLWSYTKIDPFKRINGFELYGIDIMHIYIIYQIRRNIFYQN